MFSIAAQRRPGALSCNQSWTAYCAAKALLIYPNSPSLGKVPLILTGHADQVLSCRFLSENLLISTSADKTARIYQLDQVTLILLRFIKKRKATKMEMYKCFSNA